MQAKPKYFDLKMKLIVFLMLNMAITVFAYERKLTYLKPRLLPQINGKLGGNFDFVEVKDWQQSVIKNV